MSDEKKIQVLDAALEVFLHYGFKRTTMGDIAQVAEMSRPAVYLVYSNKEEIYRAVVKREIERTLAASREWARECESLDEKLEAAFTTWVIEPYKVLQTTPDAKEFYEISLSFAADLIQEGLRMYGRVLGEIIETSPEVDETILKKMGLNLSDMALLLSRSTWKIYHSTASLKELEAVLASAVKVYGAVLAGKLPKR